MQIVIDIPEEIYKASQILDVKYEDVIQIPLEVIANGIPFPKNHGDLIDRNKIEYMKAIHDMKWGKITASECATKIKYSAPTIIEATEG